MNVTKTSRAFERWGAPVAGCMASLGILAITQAMAQPGDPTPFPCAIYPPNQLNVCYTCDECQLDENSNLICVGEITNSVSCSELLVPHCAVIVQGGEPTYIAECVSGG